MATHGFVYVARARTTGHIKIGFSTQPIHRVQQLAAEWRDRITPGEFRDLNAVTPRVLTIVKGHVLRYLEASSRTMGDPAGDLVPFLAEPDWRSDDDRVSAEAVEAVGRILAEQPGDVHVETVAAAGVSPGPSSS